MSSSYFRLTKKKKVRITDHLWWESTGHRPSQSGSIAESVAMTWRHPTLLFDEDLASAQVYFYTNITRACS